MVEQGSEKPPSTCFPFHSEQGSLRGDDYCGAAVGHCGGEEVRCLDRRVVAGVVGTAFSWFGGVGGWCGVVSSVSLANRTADEAR